MSLSFRTAVILLAVALGAVSFSPGAKAQSAAPPPISDLPIAGLAQVTFKVADLDKGRGYYNGVLGFPIAFELKDAAGKIASVYYKINDDQYVELVPGLKPDDIVRQARFVIQATDLKELRERYVERGLSPTPIAKGRDGNLVFRIVAPNGFPVDFLQYAADSRQGRLRGKLLSPDRISTHMLHVGALVKDPGIREFFETKLGFGRTLPGGRGEYVEYQTADRNLETKNPPLDPNNPATLAQYTREMYGGVYHMSLEVPDIIVARTLAQKRGGYDDVRLRVAVGNNRRWLMHLFDPYGSRTEIMTKEFVPSEIPSFSVVPPGGSINTPILANTSGVYPWP